jgi:hypothetical protein
MVARDHEHVFGWAQGLQVVPSLFEFGGQRQLGQISGYGDLVDGHRPYRLDEGIEDLFSVLSSAANFPAQVAQRSFV